MPKTNQQPLSDLIDAAFRQVAQKLALRARQTGTPLIVWRDGRVQAISPDEGEDEVALPQAEASEPREG